jgi:transposase
MNFVAIKTPEQSDLLSLHRVRSRLVRQRTAIINQIRRFLIERGITVRQGPGPLRKVLPQVLSSPPEALSPRILRLIAELDEDWRRLDERLEALSAEIESLSENDAACQRVMTVPGIGPIISSAVVAAIGTGSGFKQGRDFSAWLGLVPKQESTGDRTKLGRISKRGNKYLRTLFVQAAHVVLERRPAAAMRALWPWIAKASKRLAHQCPATQPRGKRLIHPLNPLNARRARLEWITEVLGFADHLPVTELHNAHRVRRLPVVGED